MSNQGLYGFPIGLGLVNGLYGTPSFLDTDLLAYKTRYNGSGNTLSSTVENALAVFISTLKSAGIWDKYGFLWIAPVGLTVINGAGFYLKPYRTTIQATNPSLTLTSVNDVGILAPNFNSNIQSDFLVTSGLLTWGYYSHSTASQANFDISSDGNLRITASWISESVIFDAGSNATKRLTFANPTDIGLFVGTYNGSAITVSRDKTQIGSGAGSGVTTPTALPFTLGQTSRRYSMFFAYDKGVMSSTERDIQYDAYAAFCATVGRSL
jgi:hypothetical protein